MSGNTTDSESTCATILNVFVFSHHSNSTWTDCQQNVIFVLRPCLDIIQPTLDSDPNEIPRALFVTCNHGKDW